MTDKVNKEESIARVYQFLNKQKDWKTEADKNGNGTIVKTEFRTYLLGSGFKFNNGENKEDLIDAFWKSIDTNTTGKLGGGSKASNKCALDTNEMAHVENSLAATKKIISFMQNKEAPSGIEAQYKTAWKNSVKEGLIYRASEFLKTASLEELNDEWFNNAYKLSSAKATADYTATAMIQSELGKIDGYKPASDVTLKNIVDEYVAGLEENPKDEATVISEIKKIVSAYVDTAKTNSKSSTDLLAQYGYDPYDSLNDLQVAVLVNDMTDKILGYLKNNYKDLYSDDYEAQVKAVVKEYLEKYLSDRSADEFNELKSMDIKVVTETSEFAALISEINAAQNKIQNARKELNKYVAEVLAKNDDEKTAIVQEVIGTTNATEVMDKLLAIKTVEEIEAKHTELKTRVEALDAERAAKKAAEEQANREKMNELKTDTTMFVIDNKAYSINSLINSSLRSATVELSGFQNMTMASRKALSKIDSICSAMIAKLSADYPSDLLQSAFNSVHNYYSAVLSGIGNHEDTDGKVEFAITYKNELTNNTITENADVAHGWAYNHKNIDDVGNIRDESGCDPSSGIYVGYCGGYGYIIHLDLKLFAQKLTSMIS